uniref:Transcription factor bHLH130 n=1 Tax=Pohlia nutans TaxID=140635 RepID=A0A4D6QIB0_9BRYO|nr:transcription factor bHLH130 [Pohlia nutans]
MCAEGMAVMDGAMMQQSQRATSQPPYSSGTGAVDEEISAMLNTNLAHIRQASLNGVIAPAGEQQQYPYHQLYPGAFAAARPRPPVSSSPPQQRPAFNMEEKYMLEAKPEILDATTTRGAAYRAVYEDAPGSSMLHRYHSAPASTFLTEISEGHHGVMSMYHEGPGLTPITENMDMERMGSNNFTSGEYEHYMAPENDFGRRAAFPASLRKEEAMPDTFGTSRNGTLMRQTSMPSVGLGQLHGSRMAENNNGSEKSSSRNSDDTNHLINGYTASMYSQEDFLWKSPTSPAKRHRRIEGELSETSSGSADGSTYQNNNHQLVRHLSLPNSGSTGMEDTREDNSNSFGTVPMRTRAKRGCATHPRSIAERVRRTKISERMKRLQDLVPDMDKQTNTSDMLDETVEYVKSLQQKVQELNETVAQLKAAAAAQHERQQHQQQQQTSNRAQ